MADETDKLREVYLVERCLRFATGAALSMPTKTYDDPKVAETASKMRQSEIETSLKAWYAARPVQTDTGIELESTNILLGQFVAAEFGITGIIHRVVGLKINPTDLVIPQKRIILPGHH